MQKLFSFSLALLLTTASLHAQTILAPPFQVDSTGTNPVNFEFRADGTMIAQGNYGVGSTLTTSDQGAGTRLLWYPRLAAFCAGRSDNTSWSAASVGANSVALGFDATASANYSTAIGYNTTASALYATALGSSTTASASYAAALGYHTTASGYASFSLNYYSTAAAYFSTAMGYHTTASGYASTAIGSYNLGLNADGVTAATFGATSLVPGDPLFEVGDGTSTAPSDAFAVFNNGTAKVRVMVTAPTYVITAAPGTNDIPMYH